MGDNIIRLDGWFSGECFGGIFKIFRGYADLRKLAEISVPFYYDPKKNSGYQREIDLEHAIEAKEFYEKSAEGYKFTPEIILGIRIDSEEKIISLDSGFTKEEKDMLLNPEANVIDNIEIHDAKKPVQKYGKKVSISINLDELKNKKETIRRVDGNHRLYCAHRLQDDPHNPNKYVVPFCMILLGSVNDKYDDYAEAMIFYNINQKAKIIESEHGYNVLLTAGWEDSKLFEIDPILYSAKYFKTKINQFSPELKKIFGDRPLTNIYAIIKTLKDEKLIEFNNEDEVRNTLDDLSIKLNQYYDWAYIEPLEISKTFKIIPAILLILFDDTKKDQIKYWLRSYDNWIKKNNYFDNFTNMQPADIWNIFKKWRENQPTRIFVACSFIDEEIIKSIKDTINRSIEMIKSDCPDIKIESLIIDEKHGESFELTKEIFYEIDRSEIVIADLTDERPNVYLEIGYTKAKGIPFILTYRQKNNNDGTRMNKVHADLSPYKYINYKTETRLYNELTKELKAFYGK